MIFDDLTAHQCRLLDMMFQCENPKEIYELRHSLQPRDRKELDVLVELVILDQIDNEVKEMKTFPALTKIFKK